MESSKHQAPSSREAPSANIRSILPAEGSSICWDEESPESVMVKEEPGKDDGRHPFDLEERTARFGECIIRLVKKVPRGVDHPENNRLVDQLVGAATSIGANYCEANEGISKKDFRHPISRCVKEAKETKFFLRMMAASEPQLAAEARRLYREADELLRIFASIYRK